MKLNYALLYANYPKQDVPAEVKKQIGGHVDADWITNTCAIRLSRSLNYSGNPIPSHFPGMHTVSGADHRWYAYRMQELKNYLAHTLGEPSITATKEREGWIDKSLFTGKKGIIAFDIHFADAQGHVDLWNGTSYIHEHIQGGYFTRATKVVLWESD